MITVEAFIVALAIFAVVVFISFLITYSVIALLEDADSPVFFLALLFLAFVFLIGLSFVSVENKDGVLLNNFKHVELEVPEKPANKSKMFIVEVKDKEDQNKIINIISKSKEREYRDKR